MSTGEESNEARRLEGQRLSALADDPKVIQCGNLIISQAIMENATEILIEFQPEGVEVHYRVDEVLHHVMSPPGYLWEALLTWFKLVAHMDILGRRPQAMSPTRLRHDGRDVHLHCKTRPKDRGESMSLQIVYP
jgi:type II secretory ATPase GspE/PulE/Tfp pilus assembly ATPase PilB-like protein